MKKLILAILALIAILFLIHFFQFYPLRYAQHVFEGKEEQIPLIDTDEDGLPDIKELGYPPGFPATNYTNPDTDGDGIPDGWEVKYRLWFDMAEDKYQPADPNRADSNCDIDSDGLTNLQEYLADTNPGNNDTDSDGMLDGWEVFYGLNPLANDSSLDLDDDGLSNLEEYLAGTNPKNNDTDNDGLGDYDEIYIYKTNPTNPDTDSDGMPDGWEVYYLLDPLRDDSSEDPDNDGYDFDRNGAIDQDEKFTNLEEYLAGTNPRNPDSDSDGMPDGWEVFYRLNPLANDTYSDEDLDNLTNLEEYLALTDPRLNDTDYDGLIDGDEVKLYNTSPINPDTDGDGLNDYQEVFLKLVFPELYKLYNISFTNPCAKDTDNDGLTDYEEVFLRSCFRALVWRYPDIKPTNPCNYDSDNDALLDGDEVKAWLTHPNNWDTDSDGMPDGWEVKYAVYKIDFYYWNIDPRRNDSAGDSDSDALTNFQEYLFNIPNNWSVSMNGVWWNGTNPINWDTDNDGMPDGWEFFYQLNPLANDSLLDADNDNLTNLEEYQFNLPTAWDVPLNGVWWNGTNPINWDTDNDGMPDGWEASYNLNPLSSIDSGNDEDEDNLTNLEEYLVSIPSWWAVPWYGVWWNGTSPLNPDCDSDGLLDGAEMSSYYQESEIDWDGDGNLNYNTNPLSPDTDSDTFLDGYNLIVMNNSELYRYFLNYSIAHIDNLDGTITFYGELTLGTNPLVKNETADSDGDGLTNWEEVNIYGTNPNNPDTDGDWLWDGDELGIVERDGYPNLYITNPLNPDSDCCGCWDGWEVKYGFNPTYGNDDSEDPDLDGLTNRFEFLVTDTNPTHCDTDLDRLLDGFNITVNTVTWTCWYMLCDYNITETVTPTTTDQGLERYNHLMNRGIIYNCTDALVIFIGELSIGTDPTNPDSDGGGVSDGTEVGGGTNPTNPNDDQTVGRYVAEITILEIWPLKDFYYKGERFWVRGKVVNASNPTQPIPNITVTIYLNQSGISYVVGINKTNESGEFIVECQVPENISAGTATIAAKSEATYEYLEAWDEW
ncbi:MAG: hypothetical protein QMD21_00230 [Candidatus Thermoplasmatota archaeon]|nr:hypothetical protein [Candidatus Thermoplasmatota archaeon]